MEKKLKKISQNLKQIPKTSKKIHKNYSFDRPMEMVTDPFYILDVENYSFLYANKAAQKFKALKKTTCHEHFFGRKKPCTPDEQLCPIRQVMATQKSVTLEYSIQDRKKNYRRFRTLEGKNYFQACFVLLSGTRFQKYSGCRAHAYFLQKPGGSLYGLQ